ncbi:MAG TPA: hypothetical protein VIK86_06385 [Candidatus Paceibacterota bacterium]
MNENSLEAHRIYKPQFKKTADRIFDYLSTKLTGLSAYQISKQMGIDLGTVTGRINDLKREGRVKVFCCEYRTKSPSSIYVCNFDNLQPIIQHERFTIEQIRKSLTPYVYNLDDLEFYLKIIKK